MTSLARKLSVGWCLLALAVAACGGKGSSMHDSGRDTGAAGANDAADTIRPVDTNAVADSRGIVEGDVADSAGVTATDGAERAMDAGSGVDTPTLVPDGRGLDSLARHDGAANMPSGDAAAADVPQSQDAVPVPADAPGGAIEHEVGQIEAASPIQPCAYAFIKSLVNTTYGLVDSSLADHNTTVYKNALAAMTFIHEGDLNLAHGIFRFFEDYYLGLPQASFQGFRQWWDSSTGQPDLTSTLWEGDNAFLLVALNYYRNETHEPTAFSALGTALKNWLVDRGDHDPDWYWANNLNADGLSDMYAALWPSRGEGGALADALRKIKTGFFIDYDGQAVLDHLHRASLVFGYVNDFNLGNLTDHFARTETWQRNFSVTVSAYAAFRADSFINLEISAQILSAWKVWKNDLGLDLSGLQPELDEAWILETPETCGLPYLLTYVPGDGGHGWDGCYSRAILDSTAYLLYADWGLNPFAPGQAAVSFMAASENLEAERPYASGGVLINGGDVSNIDGGDWLEYKKIDFGQGGLTSFVARLCKGSDVQGTIEIHLDSRDGTLIGVLEPTQTCTDWGTWEEQTAAISSTSSVHDVYLVFKGGTGVCNLDWFHFE